ncbi:MAG TPA: GntR family transcriptional regulator [Pseudonocardiaceae bacterium]|jgi:DNA-binding FadR family transcriptional regulator|nr:GntR family transcriptional regulator [Pseudonocardiaceae bacterium]
MGLDRTEIADQLRRRIVTGEYQPGDKLPGYRQLANSFGAAPNTVGEAVRILATEGLVTTRAGAVASVRSVDEQPAPTADRLETAQTALTELRTEIHQIRNHLSAAEKRVSDALAQLEGP